MSMCLVDFGDFRLYSPKTHWDAAWQRKVILFFGAFMSVMQKYCCMRDTRYLHSIVACASTVGTANNMNCLARQLEISDPSGLANFGDSQL